jgi:hypothetical protein
MIPFSPGPVTYNINVSSSNQSVKVAPGQRGEIQVRFMNNGTATVWIAAGGSSVAASSSTGIPIPSGGVEVLTFVAPYSDDLYIAAIAASGTGIIYMTPGAGI